MHHLPVLPSYKRSSEKNSKNMYFTNKAHLIIVHETKRHESSTAYNMRESKRKKNMSMHDRYNNCVFALSPPPQLSFTTQKTNSRSTRQHSTAPIFFGKYIVGPQIDEHTLLLKLWRGKGTVKSPQEDFGYSRTIFSENQ